MTHIRRFDEDEELEMIADREEIMEEALRLNCLQIAVSVCADETPMGEILAVAENFVAFVKGRSN